MALDYWFLVAQALGGQATPQSTPPVSQQWRKCQKSTIGAVVGDNTPSAAHLPTLALGRSTVPPTNKTP